MDKIEKIKRIIHFYELKFEFLNDFVAEDGDQFRAIFSIITLLAKTKAKIRYQEFGEKSIFIQSVKFEPENKLIIGMLRCVRSDLLPEIMNKTTDESRGIEAKEEEGLVETTHFVIDYSKKVKKIAIEYNQFGAKINDFANYVKNIGVSKNAVKTVDFVPIVKDELSKLKNKIDKFSEFIVKVHKDNLEQIKEMDGKIYSAMKASIDQFKTDYATLILKFDYRIRPETKEIRRSVFNIIGKLIKNRKKTELFNILSVKAEDKEKNDRLQIFDLLVDKVKSEIYVEKKKRYRTIVSVDIFDKMKIELTNKRL